MKNRVLRELVIIASLAAVAVVLRYFTIPIFENNRMIIYNIPVMICSFAYGPIAGMACAVIADVSSIAYQPGWNPVFIIPAALWGLIPGLMKLMLNQRKLGFLVIIEIVTHLFVSITNTVCIMYTYSFNAAFGPIEIDNFTFTIPWLTDFMKFFSIDGIIYVRIINTVLIMLVKIVVDVIVLHIINRRVVDPLILKNDAIEQGKRVLLEKRLVFVNEIIQLTMVIFSWLWYMFWIFLEEMVFALFLIIQVPLFFIAFVNTIIVLIARICRDENEPFKIWVYLLMRAMFLNLMGLAFIALLAAYANFWGHESSEIIQLVLTVIAWTFVSAYIVTWSFYLREKKQKPIDVFSCYKVEVA